MASRAFSLPPGAEHRERPGAQPDAPHEADAAEAVAFELDEVSRLAEKYLASTARLARDLLIKSGPDADASAEDTLATAEVVAVELVASAVKTAVDLLATARKVAAARLASTHRFEAMFRDSSSVMLVVDPATGQIVDANPAAATFYGYSVESLRCMPFTQISTMPSGEVAAGLTPARTSERGNVVLAHRLASGESRRVDVDSSPILDGRPLLFSIVVDIENRMRAEEELQVLATHDPLTGLANRVVLLDEISRALSAGRRSGRATAVLMIDLDRFKDVNDTLGHAAGDDLLVAVAARIVSVVRGGDLVARPGGDEFVVVMRDLDNTAEAVRAASRMVEAFRVSFTPCRGGGVCDGEHRRGDRHRVRPARGPGPRG